MPRRVNTGTQDRAVNTESPAVKRLHAAGFDLSYAVDKRYQRVRCSQCEALVINGVATHERGCPNQRQARLNFEEDSDGEM